MTVLAAVGARAHRGGVVGADTTTTTAGQVGAAGPGWAGGAGAAIELDFSVPVVDRVQVGL
ncbi:hypothetical protein BST16_09305 [Mycobacterium asiaticum DSM 44297]|nr:hypothetical protein BST16_09305 [Mycobacterium asiaticum DSM 44297]